MARGPEAQTYPQVKYKSGQSVYRTQCIFPVSAFAVLWSTVVITVFPGYPFGKVDHFWQKQPGQPIRTLIDSSIWSYLVSWTTSQEHWHMDGFWEWQYGMTLWADWRNIDGAFSSFIPIGFFISCKRSGTKAGGDPTSWSCHVVEQLRLNTLIHPATAWTLHQSNKENLILLSHWCNFKTPLQTLGSLGILIGSPYVVFQKWTYTSFVGWQSKLWMNRSNAFIFLSWCSHCICKSSLG